MEPTKPAPPVAEAGAGPPLAERFFDSCRLEWDLDEALLKAVGANPDDSETWTCSHMVYDDYDSSFELWNIKDDAWTPTNEQLDAAFALGFAQCWICYPDGTERYYSRTSRKGERHPSAIPRNNDGKYLLAKRDAALSVLHGRLTDLQADVKAAQDCATGWEAEANAEKSALAKAEAEVAALRSALADSERALKKLVDDQHAISKDYSEAHAENLRLYAVIVSVSQWLEASERAGHLQWATKRLREAVKDRVECPPNTR